MNAITAGEIWTRNGGTSGVPAPIIFRSGAGGMSSVRDFRRSTKKLSLLSNIRLISPIFSDGESLPSGAIGTVVEVLAEGSAYIIEFEEPHHCVVTVYDSFLENH